MKKIINKYSKHILVIIVFLGISYIYYYPLLEGKRLYQNDTVNHIGTSKDISDHRAKYHEEPLWTNNMFGGMPAYLISAVYKNNITKIVDKILKIGTRPASYLFITLLGFYILLLAFGINIWISAIGAIAFAFSSYFFIIIEAGHNSKAEAIAYIPPLIAGIHLIFKNKYLLGLIITTLFLSLEILAGHLQITYYGFLIILIYAVFQVYPVIIKKQYIELLKKAGIFLIAVCIALGLNFPTLWFTYDYGKDSLRGKSELSHNKENKTSGLDKDYATAWSYGIDETFTLLIPNFKGGVSGGSLSANSKTYELIEQNYGPEQANQAIRSLPLYWGAQPFTSGPVYAGAIVCLLFVLGLFLVRGPIKWWLLSATLLSFILAWGRNFPAVTNFFLDYIPGYNKFRTVSMTLVIAEFTMPLLGILALQKILSGEMTKAEFMKVFKWSAGIVGGIALFFSLLPGMFFDFTGVSDAEYISRGWKPVIELLQQYDREALLRADALRSLVFIVLASLILLGFIYKKIKLNLVYLLLALLILVDMWTINKRYLNSDNFTSKRDVEVPFKPTPADELILKDKDPDYRVFNTMARLDQDGRTSYFHKSLGGYHGAKMRRYQELIDFHLSHGNMSVINMLNTKYFITSSKEGKPEVQVNINALGNAWFIEKYRIVENADSEIVALNSFDPAREAIIDKRFKKQLEGFTFLKDSSAVISLTDYKTNHLTYLSSSMTEQLAVFSEIYYNDKKGWKAYVDGKPVTHFRVNYVLRAMRVPSGKHTIEYKYAPVMYSVGNKIALVSSILLVILILTSIFLYFRHKAATERKQ